MRTHNPMLRAISVILVGYCAWSASTLAGAPRNDESPKSKASATTRADGLSGKMSIQY